MHVEGELWQELCETMRKIRTTNGVSLRQLEQRGRWRRGTLSLAENGKLRPSQALVEFYDTTFDTHGLLTALFAEAHLVHPVTSAAAVLRPERVLPGDAVDLVSCSLPTGAIVQPGAEVTATWKIRNAGSVGWDGRRLRRIGAAAGSRLISSAPSFDVPTAEPGDTVEVACAFAAPCRLGSVVAHWRMVHAEGDYCFPPEITHSVLVIVG